MQALGATASGRVRLYDARAALNPLSLRGAFAALPPKPEPASARTEGRRRADAEAALRRERDADALRASARLVCVLDRRDGAIARADVGPDDARFADPATLRRLVGLLAAAAFGDAPPERARLALELVRVHADASGRFLPHEDGGDIAGAAAAPGASGWYCAARENVDGGRFAFRAGGGAWCQKELSVGYLAVARDAAAPVSWRMSPVFSWDRAHDGALDLIAWRADALATPAARTDGRMPKGVLPFAPSSPVGRSSVSASRVKSSSSSSS